MQDKIQEIMWLADAYAHHERMQDAWAAEQCRALIESKLRELVREPLSEPKEVLLSTKESERFCMLNGIPYHKGERILKRCSASGEV